MAKAKVTVVMPVYNRENVIKTAITSVLNQTLKDWKMIVVDDGSTDRTSEILITMQTRNIKIITLPENQGTGKALNAALRIIDTPYFVIVDSDDWFAPQTLEILLNEMEKQPKSTSLVYANTTYWKDTDGKPEKVFVRKARAFKDKYDYLMYGPMIYPRFFRTETVLQAGGFENDDPWDGRFEQDRYLLLKLIGISRFHWVDADLYHCRSHDNNSTHPRNRHKYAEVKKYIFTKMLSQWGNQYEAEFETASDGWLYIKRLNKVKPLKD